MKRWILGLTIALTPSTAAASSTVLSAGTLRIDFAPTDFSILNTGAIGGRRGFEIRSPGPGTGTTVGLGLGASFGLGGRAEVGAIVIPLGLSPDTGYGDITAHARYRLLTGTFEAALQVVVRIPTETDFGLGLGVPIILRTGSVEIQTGAEVELEFADDTVAHLDVPAAFLWNITREVFAGLRTGIYLADFDRVDIPLGAVTGARLNFTKSLALHAIASFVFERFITGGEEGLIELDTWALQFGALLIVRL